MTPRMWIALGAATGALGIALGAFGAHALPGWLTSQGRTAEAIVRAREIFETAVRYQMYQAFGLVLLGLYALHRPEGSVTLPGAAIFLGMCVFSGLLYALVITDVKVLGAIVPIGGVLMIVGWLGWAVKAWLDR
ncbi:MAG: DUF423 domain-containing protein [Planctomycetes bacterium]|nr:DUF423 domain-containing protein [Planctomycetota bacterium]